MTRKVYRTAQGKMVDLGRLQLQNENTRAVGNMGVNARGDKVDSMNRPIDKKPAQVQRQYNRQTTAGIAPAPRSRPKAAKSPVVDIPPPPEDFQDDFVKEKTAEPAATSGLAAAIARAREIKQEPLRSPQDTAKMQEGVHKI